MTVSVRVHLLPQEECLYVLINPLAHSVSTDHNTTKGLLKVQYTAASVRADSVQGDVAHPLRNMCQYSGFA